MVQSVLKVLKEAKRPLSVTEIGQLTGYSTSSFSNRLFQLQKYVGAVRVVQKYDGRNDERTKTLDEIRAYSTVKRWQAQLKEGPSRRNALYVFSYFIDYIRANTRFKDPDSLIEDALDGNRRNLLKHIEVAKSFALAHEDGSIGTKRKRYEIVRSFYALNDCGLPKSKLKFAQVVETDLDIKQEESFKFIEMMRKAMTVKASALERAVAIIQYQTGVDDSTLTNVFNFVAYYQLCQHFGTENWRNWDSSKIPVLIHLRRPKTGVKFYTFLEKDGIDCLKDWLVVRFNLLKQEIRIHPNKRADKMPLSDPIFVIGDAEAQNGGRGIKPWYPSYVFRELGFRAGINERPIEQVKPFKGASIRYLFHAHECRDSLVSLSEVKSNIVCGQFITANKIDSYHYNKSPWKDPEHFRDLYAKMAPWLNLISCDPEKVTLKSELAQTREARNRAENDLYLANQRLAEKNSISESRIKELEQRVEERIHIDAERLNKLAEQRAEEILGDKLKRLEELEARLNVKLEDKPQTGGRTLTSVYAEKR